MSPTVVHRMSKILPTLFIGSVRDSIDEFQMKTKKITHVVRISDEPEDLPKLRLGPSPRYFYVKARDFEGFDMMPQVPKVNEFVHEARLAGGVVLIHCQAGISRSVALAIGYLMSVTKYGYDDVLRLIEGTRSCSCPNRGFRTQLQDFEHAGLRNERQRLVQRFNISQEDPIGDNAEIEKRLKELENNFAAK